jgi:hypothetical protein
VVSHCAGTLNAGPAPFACHPCALHTTPQHSNTTPPNHPTQTEAEKFLLAESALADIDLSDDQYSLASNKSIKDIDFDALLEARMLDEVGWSCWWVSNPKRRVSHCWWCWTVCESDQRVAAVVC